MSSEIIVGGKPFSLNVIPGQPQPIVLTWHDHGLTFVAGQGFNKKRKARIDLAVWHWTGGESEPPQMVEILKARGYGVEFAIARTGVIWQFADPLEVDTADAAGFNARSVGTEIVSYGMAGREPGWKTPKAGADRQVKETFIHGVKVKVASFYPVQLEAARALAIGLSSALGIQRRVPMIGASVTARTLATVEAARFTGHAGHYHLTAQKCDPGPAFMEELRTLFTPPPPATLTKEVA
jgi:hypothetical protein